ncbi:MAG: CoA transferase [Oscillospiraceae bacterium]|nr:CoA transferase [Oscillospiraceae bacterium]
MSSANTLAGVKVVELSTFIAVPACARFFADNGADVIKIESAGGDAVRWNGTSEGRSASPYENTTFDLENANKRGVVLNLKTPEGKEILFKLLEDADVFLTNWRPQALAKNGLTYEALHEKFPKLVYGTLTGYGEKGPDKDLPGFDFTAYWARGGVLDQLRQKDEWPINLIPGMGDHQSGLFLAAGVMAALFNAQRTGCGEKVQINLLHTSIFIQAIMIQAAQYKDMGLPYPIDRHDANNPFNCAYRTADGRFLQLSMPPFDVYFPKFMPLIGRADLVGNPRYTMDSITENHLNREFIDILSEAMEQKTAAEWAEIFTANEIPFATANTWEEVLEDEQAWANDAFYTMPYPTGNDRTLVRQPIFIGDAVPDYKMAPMLGEHSEEVIKQLGYTDEQLAAMHKKGVYNTWEDLKAKHNG